MRYAMMSGGALDEARALLDKLRQPFEYGRGTVVFGAWEDERLVGLCLGRLGAAAELAYVYVHGLYRRQGVARTLVERLKQAARERHAARLVAQFISSGRRAQEQRFLAALGFSGLQQGETLLSMTLAELEQSSWAQAPATRGTPPLEQIDELSAKRFAQYKLALHRALPDIAGLPAVQGTLRKELSYVLMTEGEVRLTALVSDYEGDLYLGAFYCAPGWERRLPELVHTLFYRLTQEEAQDRRLYVTCVNAPSYRLAVRLADGLSFTERTAWRMYLPL